MPTILPETEAALRKAGFSVRNPFTTLRSWGEDLEVFNGPRPSHRIIRRIRGSSVEYVVIRLNGRGWQYLSHTEWVDAMAPTDPRADIAYAIDRATLAFPTQDDALLCSLPFALQA